MVYQGVADNEYRNGKFPFRWGYGRSTLYFFLFCPCLFFMLEKNIYLFAKPWLAYTSNHIIGSSDPRGASGRFRLGAILGNLLVPCVLYEGVLIFFVLLLFFTGLNIVFVPPRMERKPAVLV